MVNVSREDLEFLIGCSQCMFDYGMVNWSNESYDEFERIKKKYEKKRM